MNLAEHLAAVLSIDPAAPAIEYHDRWTTWGELRTIGNQLDAILDEAGLGPGTPVACLLRTRPEHIGVVLGLLTTNRTVVTVNPQQGDDKLVTDLRALRPPVVVADPDAWASDALHAVVDEIEAVAVTVHADPASVSVLGAPAGDARGVGYVPHDALRRRSGVTAPAGRSTGVPGSQHRALRRRSGAPRGAPGGAAPARSSPPASGCRAARSSTSAVSGTRSPR